ncbi:protein B4 [Cyclopterus lumpus]|uniref:protein B4 n=1 Tax=Cyclopterus lumpus TaxID=8103 RepID=UPI0014864D1B|nr:protein B4 [Cyclopterus lumpus]
MPPKKPAADSAEPPMPSSSDAPVEEKKPDAAALRKLATHPTTAIMVKEALEELDSRKGLSSQAIQSYIKQKYPSVDLVRLKHLVRRALKKGIETGTLVRPVNSKVTTGAMGKFRLAPKVKEAKPTTENVDPNVEKVPKAAKDGAKKPKKAGVAKKEDSANEEDESKEEHNPPKRSKKVKEAATSAPTTSKVAPAKKPKARKAAEKDDGEGAKTTVAKATKESAKATKESAKATKESAKATKESAKATKESAKATKESTKEAAKATKEAAKATKESTKEAKAGKAPQSKAAKASSEAPAAKATGKRGRKTAE